MANTSLTKAKKEKNDEFYTQLADIENELRHYTEHFKGKVVFCNCDDPYESNFFKYFAMHFNHLGLKKLIATSYIHSPVAGNELNLFSEIDGEQFNPNKKAYKVVMSELKDVNNDGREDLIDVQQIIKHRIRYLKGDGDFRSEESIELLKQADIVVTNPPFSLFREYLAQLMEYQKSFLIIGSKNAITYKEVFPLIKANKLWLGVGFANGNAFFKIPLQDGSTYASGVYDPSTQLVKFRNCAWFTNLDHKKRHETLPLFRTYKGHEEDYPKYDNYNAINVNKVADIPCDYDGVMGVPITFLDKYNPEQFEIVGNEYTLNIIEGRGYINGKRLYSRIFIKKAKANEN